MTWISFRHSSLPLSCRRLIFFMATYNDIESHEPKKSVAQDHKGNMEAVVMG